MGPPLLLSAFTFPTGSGSECLHSPLLHAWGPTYEAVAPGAWPYKLHCKLNSQEPMAMQHCSILTIHSSVGPQSQVSSTHCCAALYHPAPSRLQGYLTFMLKPLALQQGTHFSLWKRHRLYIPHVSIAKTHQVFQPPLVRQEEPAWAPEHAVRI